MSLKETMREDMSRIPETLIEARRGRGERATTEPAIRWSPRYPCS